MPLTSTPAAEADTIGATETISLFSSAALIASATYGCDASGNALPATIAADKRSLTIKVLANQNLLTVEVVSPASKSETVVLYQGDPVDNPLATFDVDDGTGVATIQILGT